MKLVIITSLFFLSGCLLGPPSNGDRLKKTAVSNSVNSLDPGYGRLIEKNPIVLTGDESLAADVNISTIINKNQEFITSNQFLQESCFDSQSYEVTNCLAVFNDDTSSPITKISERWAYDPNSDEFLQIHTFAHMRRLLSRYESISNYVFTQSQANVNAITYRTSIPSNFYAGSGHWLRNHSLAVDETLIAYSNCGLFANAFFSPADFSLCFGADDQFAPLKFAQDPSIIYHELGHMTTKLWLNIRNTSSNLNAVTRADLGYLFYDEAGSIGEGVADYFSYAMNSRERIGEWALGRFRNLDRPLSEDQSFHAPGISSDFDSRLKYPDFVNYDARFSQFDFEDVHAAGQITSHYLVALTKDLKSECGMSQEFAVNNVMYLLAETFSELGDLSAQGSDHSLLGGLNSSEDTVNLNSTSSREWLRLSNPINYRKFYQTFSKNLYRIMNKNFGCRSSESQLIGSAYPQDNIEQILDMYGLLLFDTYNNDGNNVLNGHAGTVGADTLTQVDLVNRVQTVLIDKDRLIFDPTSGAPKFFIFDQQNEIRQAIENMTSQLENTLSDQIPSDLGYNNGNGFISPGEVVGISLNLYNDSNSTMAGVQVLANDWDHFKQNPTSNIFEPCGIFEDQFPDIAEGGAVADAATPISGDCGYTTRTNGEDKVIEPLEDMYPVCFIQTQSDGSTVWGNQEQYMSEIGWVPADSNKCLGGSGQTKDCFIRVLKGADNSYFSKLSPKKTWAQSLNFPNDTGNPEFNLSNLIFFEVNPYVPPGTKFNCRFRARFTNCSNCFSDDTNNRDDFLDYEYSGAGPFKIFNIQFTVVN